MIYVLGSGSVQQKKLYNSETPELHSRHTNIVTLEATGSNCIPVQHRFATYGKATKETDYGNKEKETNLVKLRL